MSPRQSISAKILAARRQKKLKQEVLSAAIGCSRSYISKLENGSVIPSITLAAKLEHALHLKKGALALILADLKQKENLLKEKARLSVLRIRAAAARPALTNGHVKMDGHAARKDGPKKKVNRS